LRLKSVEVGRTMVEMSSSWWACVQVVVVVYSSICVYVSRVSLSIIEKM
jgi:hypothetical protein